MVDDKKFIRELKKKKNIYELNDLQQMEPFINRNTLELSKIIKKDSFFCIFCFFFLIYRMSLLMEALVTDVEVAVDFILPAIHKAVEQEVRH